MLELGSWGLKSKYVYNNDICAYFDYTMSHNNDCCCNDELDSDCLCDNGKLNGYLYIVSVFIIMLMYFSDNMYINIYIFTTKQGICAYYPLPNKCRSHISYTTGREYRHE